MEKYESPFRLQREEYGRDIDIVNAYIEQSSVYIQIKEQLPKSELPAIREQVKQLLAVGGSLAHTFPTVRVFVRDVKTGDRFEKHVPIDKLFRAVMEKGLISTPALTFYLPENVKRSKLSQFMERNVAKRAAVKEEMFAADRAGNVVLKINKKNEQNSVKTLNNGLSGALSSPYTI